MLDTLLIIAAAVLCVLLEMYLAHKPARWPGLVLPAAALLFSLLYPLNMADLGGDRGALKAQLLLVWLIANVPTAVLLAIYAAARRRVRRGRERDKMSAQDLG